jgi:Fe-Mn family superoxide dismutase
MKQPSPNSRRKFIIKTSLAAAGLLNTFHFSAQPASAAARAAQQFSFPAGDHGFMLAPLPYAYEALEPFVDAKTMEIHYTKHHQGYVDKLNAALAKHHDLQHKTLDQLLSSIETLPESVRASVRNQGGGHWNHTFFWQVLAPRAAAGEPTGRLKDAMMAQWQTIENFKAEYSKAGAGVFGSGWVWMVADANGKLSLVTTPNQDNPLMDVSKEKGRPVLGIDVWEHAYYLKHQNKRADYLESIWNVINWKRVAELYG